LRDAPLTAQTWSSFYEIEDPSLPGPSPVTSTTMSTPEGVFERSVYALVTRLPGWAVGAVALIMYPGLGLVLPLSLGASTFFLVLANLLGTTLAACVSLGRLGVQLDVVHRRHLLEWTTNLRLLNPTEFEWLVGEVFRREGWTVNETGREDEPDGNIDLDLTRNGQRMIVQCKAWKSMPVGVDQIRLFQGTLHRERLPGDCGIFVTLSRFTEQARKEAQKSGVTLIDNRDLFSLIEKVRRPEPCPLCTTPMTLDHSQHGWWLRCVKAPCTGKRDLGADAGQALQLLMQPQ